QQQQPPPLAQEMLQQQQQPQSVDATPRTVGTTSTSARPSAAESKSFTTSGSVAKLAKSPTSTSTGTERGRARAIGTETDASSALPKSSYSAKNQAQPVDTKARELQRVEQKEEDEEKQQ